MIINARYHDFYGGCYCRYLKNGVIFSRFFDADLLRLIEVQL